MKSDKDFDIDDELDKIIFQYHLDDCYPTYKEQRDIEKLIKKLTNGWRHKNVLCISTRRSDLRHFKCNLDSSQQVSFVVCESRTFWGRDFAHAFNCEALEKIDFNIFDEVYVISLYGEIFISHWLRLHGVRYCLLYEYFRDNGFPLERDYESFLYDRSERFFLQSRGHNTGTLHPITFELFEVNAYLRTTSTFDNTRLQYLKRAFFLSIVQKNFRLAETYLREIKDYGTTGQKYKNAWDKINSLLNRIKETLNQRQKRVIIMYWIDNVSARDVKDMSYISGMLESGVNFTQMYTCTPLTNPTARALFCGMKTLDDTSYKINEINLENSKVLRMLKAFGISFSLISGRLIDSFANGFLSDHYHSENTPCSMLLWDSLRCVMSSNEQRQFLLVHLLQEVHPQYISNQITDLNIADEKVLSHLGRLEVDEQISYYDKKFFQKSERIFMSDHGGGDFLDSIHPFFSICGNNVQQKKIGGLCSYLWFDIILERILTNQGYEGDGLTRDYIEIQGLPQYNPRQIFFMLRDKLPLNITQLGYKGIITKEELYFCFHDNIEWYQNNDRVCALPYISSEISDCVDSQKLLWFRSKVKFGEVQFIDEEKFSYSKYIFSIYDSAIARKKKCISLVNQLFDTLDSYRIALRMGGEHTHRLYQLLSNENRKRIMCIIDNNDSCRCKTLGIPIFGIEEITNVNHLQYIVLSSWFYLKELRIESETYPKNIEIVDIYEWLEENDIRCDDDFWRFKITDADYSVKFPLEEVGLY